MPDKISIAALAGASEKHAPIRILIADDHGAVCAGLERVISGEADMEICGKAEDGAGAIELAARLMPDVAVLDMQMEGLTGLEAARQIRENQPGCEVLLFTGLETDELMRQAFAAGVKSFILKTDARVHLLEAIRALAQHRPYFTNKVSAVLFARLLEPGRGGEGPEPGGRLSAREYNLLRRLALGETNNEIAKSLGFNLRTVEGHRAALMKKMSFASVADLVRYAVRNGVVEA